MDCNQMLDYIITQTQLEEELNQIRDSLFAYNLNSVPALHNHPREACSFILKDGSGTIMGGLVGRMFLSAFLVEFLWVSEALRYHGFGSKLLDTAERTAREKGCRFISLDTFSFQAPEFYKKQGFEVFGILDGFPDNIRRYYLKKTL